MSGVSGDSLDALTQRLREFAIAREWQQFHSPKNLAMALVGEAGELVAEFQWLTESQSRSLDEAQLARVRNEMADVFLYLLQLADAVGVNLVTEASAKIEENEQRYPVTKARGNSRKYTEY